jgi:hypothetical protein
MRSALALTTVLTAVACGDDGTGPGPDPSQQARVQGRIEQTAPEGAAYPSAQAMRAGATGDVAAKTVTVAQVASDGSLSALAQANVNADGSFTITEVPTGRENLVVIAKSDSDETVGRVLVFGRTEANTTITTAPINYETSVKALAYSRLKANGKASLSSSAEVALLVHADASAAATIMAQQEVDAMANGAAVAGDAMTRVYAGLGTTLDASARADATAQAAIRFALDRYDGTSVDAAYETYANAALDAYVGAGASLESVVTATAAAASTFDASLYGHSTVRGNVVSEAVRLNLKAREKLAARFQSGAEGSVALAIMGVLADADARVRGASTAADIRAALDAGAAASANATVNGVLDFLIPGGSVLLRSQVEAKAQEAVTAARLQTRLSAAASAEAAAQACADYRANVRAEVQAMLEAAERTDLDVEAMTSLYIAAHGGAYVRAG